MTPTFLTAAVLAPLMLGDQVHINIHVPDHDSEAVAYTLEVQR